MTKILIDLRGKRPVEIPSVIERLLEAKVELWVQEQTKGIPAILYYEKGLLKGGGVQDVEGGWVDLKDKLKKTRAPRKMTVRAGLAERLTVKGVLYLSREQKRELKLSGKLEQGPWGALWSTEEVEFGFQAEGARSRPAGFTTLAELQGWLSRMGFETAKEGQIIESKEELRWYLERWRERQKYLPFETKGVSVRENCYRERELMKTINRHEGL